MTAWGDAWGSSWGDGWGSAAAGVQHGGDGTDYRRRKSLDLEDRLARERFKRSRIKQPPVDQPEEIPDIPTVELPPSVDAHGLAASTLASLAFTERKKAVDMEAMRQRRALQKQRMQDVYAQQLVERAKRQEDDDTMLALLLAA